jgi:hypothetical protein
MLLKQRLETTRDKEMQLHLRISAWNALTAADLHNYQEEGDFEDFNE